MKSVNDMVGPNGLVPTIIVLGIMPLTPIRPHGLPEQMYRMRAMQDARSEMQKLSSHTRLQVAISRCVPGAAGNEVTAGDELFIYR